MKNEEDSRGVAINPTDPVNTQKPVGENKDQTDNGTADPIKLAQQVGELTRTAQEFEDYKKRTEPVLQVILGNPDLYKQVEKGYQEKYLGVKSDDEAKKPEEKPAGDVATPKTPIASDIEQDNRNALITQTVNSWEKEHGIDKLAPEKKTELNQKVLRELSVMLDPTDSGKTPFKLLEGVSLSKLPSILERAYVIATLSEREKETKEKAVEEYKAGAVGMIGSIPSGATKAEDVTLSEKERQIAKKMGISEEKYLANKIELGKRNNQIY